MTPRPSHITRAHSPFPVKVLGRNTGARPRLVEVAVKGKGVGSLERGVHLVHSCQHCLGMGGKQHL